MKKNSRPERILIDTGFWIALFNQRDGYHNTAQNLIDLIIDTNMILPWPTLYETINTRLSKNTNGITHFDKILKMPNIVLLDDTEYKERALNFTIENSIKSIRPISLVDSIIREILSDINVNIDYLLTFNIGDFIDLCLKRKVQILYK
jgi:predicted nucleic acid-binding protein